MRARCAGLFVAGLLFGCNDPGAQTGDVDAGDEGAPDREGGAGGPIDAPAVDGPAVMNGAKDASASADVATLPGGDAGPGPRLDARGVDSAASCVTQTLILGRGGTTSSCSFKVPSTIPRDQVNVLLGGGRLCRQGSNNCTPRGGWFWFGDDIALCDATCIAWEESRANLVLEAGCATESCFVACRQEGGPCGDGVNSCCVGFRCTNRTCATCTRGGQACSGNADCCNGLTCQNGLCVGGLGTACESQAGCTQGQCRDGRCQCAVGQILCSGGCVSFTDPNNCRGCGNVCPAGSGRVCTVNGCVCDPQGAFPDECNGTCVNKSNDRTNCGFCSYTCPKLEQVCNAGVCGCPNGQMDCNGSCVDTNTSITHCGMCNRPCSPTSEVCKTGQCDCAPGLERCSGSCVNLKTNKYHCNGCGIVCPGNKVCVNGACS